MQTFAHHAIRTLAAIILAAGTTNAALAQATPPKDQELLRDFIHYVRIDRADLAKSFGEALLKRLAPPLGTAAEGAGLSLTDFVAMLDQSGELQRFEEATARAQRQGEVEAVASQLLNAYQNGKLEQARNPTEVARNIALLTGTQRQRLVARERLIFAGEYAVPELLASLTQRTDLPLSSEARRLLVDMGRQAQAPLIAALAGSDAASQEAIARVLGEIPYRTSVPALADLAATTKTEAVKAAAEAALAKLGADSTTAPALLYRTLGEEYYRELASLTSFPGEAQQLVWTYDAPSSRLRALPVRSEVFHEAMAMSYAEKALSRDPADQSAIALWVAANFKREIESPKDYQNPLYPKDRRGAMFYAVTAGPRVGQAVLGRAIDTKNTALSREAIASIEQTAGAAILADEAGGRNALLESLRYPNRRVQYEAALALAAAQPRGTFAGAERVVPVLGSAIRDAGAKFAAVVAAKPEEQQSLASVLKGLGYTVLAPGLSLGDIELAIAEAPGVDILVSSLPAQATNELIAAVRVNTKLAVTPMLSLLTPQGVIELEPQFKNDPTVRFLRQGTDPKQQAEAATQLVESASGGPISAEDAAAYQAKSIVALRDLAVQSQGVLKVVDASGPLVSALNNPKNPTRLQVADVIARVEDQGLQRALAEAALSAEGDTALPLINLLTASCKRFGNLLEPRQVDRIVARAGKGDDQQATAIASLVGALNVASGSITPQILGTPAK